MVYFEYMRMPLELAGERYPSSIAKAVIERLKPTKSVRASDPNPCIGVRNETNLLITAEAQKEMAGMTPLQKRALIARYEIAAFESARKGSNSRALLSSFTK